MTQADPPTGGPPPLSYRPPRDDARPARPRVQAATGFVAALLACAAINFVAGFYILDSPQPWEALGTVGVCLAGLGLTAGLGWLLRRRGRWPAFLPGALLGWGLAAVSEGICYLSLKNMSSH